MKVTIKEMASSAIQQYDEPQIGTLVGEMITDAVKLKDFGFSDGTVGRGRSLAESVEDEAPEFVVVRTEEGMSRGGKLYDANCLTSIAEQVVGLQPVGHLGHISDDDFGSAFPVPQTTWFGAITKDEPSQLKDRLGQVVKVIYTAGYNLPGTEIRKYLRTKVVNSTSWAGRATLTPIPGKGFHVKDFKLFNLDWARKLAEGMPTAAVVAVTREMEEGRSMDKELSQVTPDEFKEANPNGHALLVNEAVAEKDKTIREMQEKLDSSDEDKALIDEVKKTLKLADGEDVLTKLASLMKRLGERARVVVDGIVDAVLAEKVPDEATRKMVRRLSPVTEMQAAAENAPDTEAAEKVVREMLDAAFDADEDIQSLVSEMSPPIPPKHDKSRQSGAGDKGYAGMTKTTVKMGGGR